MGEWVCQMFLGKQLASIYCTKTLSIKATPAENIQI